MKKLSNGWNVDIMTERENMKRSEYTIGIIGGMGSYATVDFFSRIVRAIPAEKEWDRPRIIVDNNCTMPSRVKAILYGEGTDELVKKLSESTQILMNAHVSRIILACNTSHVFLPDIIKNIPESKDYFINIIEECGKYLNSKKYKSIGLVASEGTIEAGIFPDILRKYNIHINMPDKYQYGLIRKFIETIKQDRISDKIIEEFIEYLSTFNEEAIVLGCTELPILYSKCKSRKSKMMADIVDPLQCIIDKIVSEFYSIYSN